MTVYLIKRTDAEIDDQLGKLDEDATAGGASKWPGMTYEQGVMAMFDWLTGATDELPVED